MEGAQYLSTANVVVAEVAHEISILGLLNKMTTKRMQKSCIHMTMFNLIQPDLAYLIYSQQETRKHEWRFEKGMQH